MNALEIRQLTKTYAKGTQALKGISFDVAQGDFFALLGPNGAGKSTTIGIICTLVLKSSGTVKVFGVDLDAEPEQAKSLIGIVPQEMNFSQFEPPLQIVVNHAGFYGVPRKLAYQRAEQYLTQMGLWEKRHLPARTLSGGMKRRLMIARALMHQPRLLILDEPTAGVDIELRRSLWDYLRNINHSGTTVILTTHYLEEAELLCKNIAIINQGEIIEQSDMKSLLSKLHVETFVLDLQQPLRQLPLLAGVTLRLTDSHTLEVEISKATSMNELFAQLSAANIQIKSLRNKANRLEELFVRLVNDNGTP